MIDACPVLIVGAGPTGLVLGCELARRGLPCRVVEQAPRLFVGSRGKGLQPRTLEVFDDLGVLDDVTAGGAPFPPFRMYAGAAIQWERSLEEMLRGAMPEPSPGVPYPRPWLIPQSRTDRILHDRFIALGGRVDLATALTGFTQDADGVTATLVHQGRAEAVRAQFLVGADGGHSTVRKTSGAGFAGETYETERTLIGDVRVTGLSGVACHILTRAGDPTKRCSLWNLPGTGDYQFVATMAADEVPALTLASVQQLIDERSGRTDVRVHELRWLSLYKVNVRMADRFRIGRVFLAGDAAHVHSSAGGQGLNTSVQDAYNLGWKLAAVQGGADPALLDTYEEERWPVAAQVLGMTTALHERGFRPSTGQAPALHQLDITYRGSSLAVDDRPSPGGLRAGDRAPDARLPDGTRLFDAFRGPHVTLLAFGHDAVAGDHRTKILQVGRLDGYDVDAGHVVLVRPDGYIGAITASSDTLRAYLARLR
jgi:2-polyprenyl-6-methoxyphenol hydroxylase-like FAD-dependent oxidoreductase